MIISEENNQIYTFKEEYLNKIDFIQNQQLNEINDKENKIIDIIESSINSCTFLLNQKNEIYCIDNRCYNKENNKNIKDIVYPFKIRIKEIHPQIKIKCIAASLKSIYIIDINGNLYESDEYFKDNNIKNNNELIENINSKWIKVISPLEESKFIDCACGNDHFVCIIKDSQGIGKLYAKGENGYYQCGVGKNNNRYIKELVPCIITFNSSFKSVFANEDFSAAITFDNQLYIWGNLNNYTDSIKSPSIVKNSLNKSLLFDKIYLGNNKLFAIVKAFENGNYIKKIITIEEEDEDYYVDYYNLVEVKLFNSKGNTSRIIPIKLCLGKDNVYVLCLQENELLKKINENKNFDKGQTSMKINIKKNNEKNPINDVETIYDFENLDNYGKILNSFSDINIERTVKYLDDIHNKKGIDIAFITYDKFILNYTKENEKKDLFLFFKENKENEGKIMFEYIKTKTSIMMNYFKKLIGSYSISEDIKNKIILKNILYLPENIRIEYFNRFLKKNCEYYDDYYSDKPYIKIDRFKANEFYEKFNQNSEKIPDIELNQTIFGQLFNSLKNFREKEFIIRKNKRFFRVELQGEEAVDEGGPYHETISLMCDELQSEYLDLFIKTPNNKNNLGESRDKYIVNPNANRNIYKKAYEFLGRFMGMAIYSGEALGLNLHPIIWKSILENKIDFEEYKTIDLTIYNFINEIEQGIKRKEENIVNISDLYFVIKNSNNVDIELIKDGRTTKVTFENLDEYINLAKSMKIKEIETQMEFIKKGIYSVIDKQILQILNWNYLEEIVCGKNKLDIKDFRTHTVYTGYSIEDNIIKWFWKWLKGIDEEKQFKYLKFVSGRTRLPKPGSGSNYTHKITKVSLSNVLPRAATCFFTLKLPNYDSKKLFVEKMEYVIENSSGITDN